MRIGVVVFSHYLRDGRVRRAAEALAARGDIVRVVSLHEDGQPRSEVIRGVQVDRVPIRRLSLTTRQTRFRYLQEYSVFGLEAGRQLLRWHREAPLDLVHVHNMPDALVFAALPAKLRGVPVLLDVHDLMPDIYVNKFGAGGSDWMVRALVAQARGAAAFADAVLTVSEETRSMLVEYGIPRDRIHVVLNTSDDDIFRWRGFKEPGDRFVIAYAGSISRRHGLDLAIRAVVRYRERFPAPPLLKIVGEGDAALELERLVEELDAQEYVSLHPHFLPVEQLPEFLSDADLGIVPYRKSPATDLMLPCKVFDFGNVGIPCIVSYLACVSHYFDDSHVRYVAPGEVESLGEAMIALAQDVDERRRLVAAMRQRCRDLSWPAQRKVLLSVVDQTAATRGPPLLKGIGETVAEGMRGFLLDPERAMYRPTEVAPTSGLRLS